ncbi:metallophosphoesterase family protein [Halobacillus mangrovi]|uniref:metallophosphoesterase family protein n=1 Tax=Halobacillus mangrovi TaxID=402384 RepID=UPI003D96BBF9
MHSKLRFIHSADLHLDSLFKSKSHYPEELLERLRKSTFEAFERLINQAIEHQVDFILLVGDLFNESVRSLKAQVFLRNAFQNLYDHGIEVFISYGNHDYLQGDRYPIAFPRNVHVFSSQEIETIPFYKNDQHIANIYGFSYMEREIRERKVNEFKISGDPQYHIAMLHGSLETNTDHDVYAPFRMEELYNHQMDYWALGHIHQRLVLSEDPPAIYPGNIQGRSTKEAGEKGCYLIEFNGADYLRTFIDLHSFTFESVTVPCDHLTSPHELEQVLQQAKSQVSQRNKCTMLEVNLTSNTGELRKWEGEELLGEWVNIVNETENITGDWIYIHHVKVEDLPFWNEGELKKGQHFIGEFLRGMDDVSEEEVQGWLAPLFKHRNAAKHMNPLTREEILDEMESAKVMVIDQLLKREDQSS